MRNIASLIDRVLASGGDVIVCEAVKKEVHALCDQYPLYGQ